MDKNHNKSNFFNSPNNHEKSYPQTHHNHPNPQFPPNPFHPQPFQNNPISFNAPTQQPQFGWCPPEYWPAMPSQFCMPPPTNHPPPPTFPSSGSKKASSNPRSTNNATTQAPFNWCPPEYWPNMANQYSMPSNDKRKAKNNPGSTNNATTQAPFNSCPPQYWPAMANQYFTPLPTNYHLPPTMHSNESRRTNIGKKSSGPPLCLEKDDDEEEEKEEDEEEEEDEGAEEEEDWKHEEDILLCKSFIAVSQEMEMEKKAQQSNNPIRSIKKARTCESKEHNTPSSSTEADDDDSDDGFLGRPMEQEAAKAKGKVNANPNLSILGDVKGHLDLNVEIPKANAEETHSRANDPLLVREYDILMRNTEGMTEEQLKVHNHFCGILRKKWGLN